MPADGCVLYEIARLWTVTRVARTSSASAGGSGPSVEISYATTRPDCPNGRVTAMHSCRDTRPSVAAVRGQSVLTRSLAAQAHEMAHSDYVGRGRWLWTGLVCLLVGVPGRGGAEPQLRGEWSSAACVHGRVEAFAGKLQLAPHIDSLTLYGADEVPGPLDRGYPRNPLFGTGLVGTFGRACVHAKDTDACRARVARASLRDATCLSTGVCPGFAVLTSGDRVWRIEQANELRPLLQLPIDSAAELLLMAALSGIPFRCDEPCMRTRVGTELRALEDGLGFQVRSPRCDGCELRYDTVDVSSAGVVSHVTIQPPETCHGHTH